jgi:hypothetical protein
MEIKILIEYLQAISYIVTIFGLPLAVFLFYHERKKERKDREYGTYNALDDKYIHFLELCLERPELDVFDLPMEKNYDKKKRQIQILYLILISVFERAYLMYRDQNNKIKQMQWVGWVEYIQNYCARESFRAEWPNLGPQFDKKFVAFIDSLIIKEIDPKN